MLSKFLLLLVLLIIACVFAVVLLFRLVRTSQQIGDLHKKLAVNDFELQAKIDGLKNVNAPAIEPPDDAS